MRMTKRQADAINKIIQDEVQDVFKGRKLVSERVRLTKINESILDKDILSEEYLHGVPEWQLRKDVTDFVNVVRGRIKGFILINKSENSLDQRESIDAMNDVCDDLEEKVYDVLEAELFEFTRRV